MQGDTMTPAEQAALHKANGLLGHWMGGINPCRCTRCTDVAQAIERAVKEAVFQEQERMVKWATNLRDLAIEQAAQEWKDKAEYIAEQLKMERALHAREIEQARREEREACAQLLDAEVREARTPSVPEWEDWQEFFVNNMEGDRIADVVGDLAAAIRARGEA